MEDTNKQILIWEKRKFWIRVVLLSAILVALLYVGVNAGGDPCERCRLQIDDLGDREYSCREIIEELVLPRYIQTPPSNHANGQNISETLKNLTISKPFVPFSEGID